METWIIADGDALARFYGDDFGKGKLPTTVNLEEVSKAEINCILKAATKHTQKKEYHKLKHGSVLLKKLDPATVSARCPSCATLFTTLDGILSG